MTTEVRTLVTESEHEQRTIGRKTYVKVNLDAQPLIDDQRAQQEGSVAGKSSQRSVDFEEVLAAK